ncbi:unnamed protein product [Schistosoma mattheei]|uniref:Uncharacterized protein n=1 Tax=Schistosoma mattheei TaxID=31246 RepID=A0A183PSR9_9TREM|nr:unnamed protein product [Schistosoma mattheei]
MLLYSGDEEENAPHTWRIALMLSNEAPRASKMIKASLKTKKEGITMNVIQCFAPTNDINDDNEDQFDERL